MYKVVISLDTGVTGEPNTLVLKCWLTAECITKSVADPEANFPFRVQMSSVMRKHVFCICDIKNTDHRL